MRVSTVGHGPEEVPVFDDAAVLTTLSEAQLQRLRGLGSREEVVVGEVLMSHDRC